MMDVLDGNRERALRYLLTTLMLVTLRAPKVTCHTILLPITGPKTQRL